jgi:hypothetical protein
MRQGYAIAVEATRGNCRMGGYSQVRLRPAHT